MKRVVSTSPSRLLENNKKKKIHPIEKRTRQKKPLYGTQNSAAPYYDPHHLHVHIWKFGILQTTLEDHTNPYYAVQNKEYHGNYCKICHETNNRFNQSLFDTQAGYSEHSTNLFDCKSELNFLDEKDEREKMVYKRWKLVLGKVLHRKVWGVRYPSDPVTEDLILENVCCDFYSFSEDGSNKIRKGIIICQLPDKKVMIVENFTAVKYQVNSHFVFPIYDKYISKKNLYAIGEIPRMVLSENVQIWKDKWNYYKKWESCQERLKFILPEQCQYFQSFYDDEVPQPVYSGPDTYDIYISKQVQYNMQLIREYKKKSDTMDLFRGAESTKYKIYTFFVPPDGIYENYVVVEKENEQVRTYPTLKLYSRQLLKLERQMDGLDINAFN